MLQEGQLQKLQMRIFEKPSWRITLSRASMIKPWKQEKWLKIYLSWFWRTKYTKWCNYLIKLFTRYTYFFTPPTASSPLSWWSFIRPSWAIQKVASPRVLGKMKTDVRRCATLCDDVRRCQVCHLYKPETQKPQGKLQQTVVHGSWETLGTDRMAMETSTSSRERTLPYHPETRGLTAMWKQWLLHLWRKDKTAGTNTYLHFASHWTQWCMSPPAELNLSYPERPLGCWAKPRAMWSWHTCIRYS